MLAANVLVMFLIDFPEQARVASKQKAVERNSDSLLLREGCTQFWYLQYTHPSSNWDCVKADYTEENILAAVWLYRVNDKCLIIMYIVFAAIYNAIYCTFAAY